MEIIAIISKNSPAYIWEFIGGLFTVWFGYRGFHSYAIIREKRTNLKNHAIKLINAFKPDLEKLRTIDGWHLGDTQNILIKAYECHSKAAFNFISSIDGTERIEFSEAWERYKGDEEYKKPADIVGISKKDRKLMQYIAQSTERENRDLAIKNIEHLLSFVKI